MSSPHAEAPKSTPQHNDTLLGDDCSSTDPDAWLNDKWQSPKLRWYHWAIVILVDMLGPFSTDSYIPNMPAMVDELHTTQQLAGVTLQANWVVKAFATVAIGFISDQPRIGRKKAILGAFVFYIVGTLGCGLVPRSRGSGGIYWLILFRVVQALGEASTAVSSAIARDVLGDDPDRMMRMLALLVSIRPLMIIAAPRSVA